MPVFGEDEKKKGTAAPLVNEIVGRVNDNTKRLRLIEQREKLLTSRISSMDESVAGKVEGLENSKKDLDAKISALEEKLTSVQNTMHEVVKQLQFLARKSEVKKVDEKLRILEPLLSQIGTQASERPQGE
jgi:uncharacterized coiled-coil protein SlyX